MIESSVGNHSAAFLLFAKPVAIPSTISRKSKRIGFCTIPTRSARLGLHDLSCGGRDNVLLRNDNGAGIYWTGTDWGVLGNVLAGNELVGTGVFPLTLLTLSHKMYPV